MLGFPNILGSYDISSSILNLTLFSLPIAKAEHGEDLQGSLPKVSLLGSLEEALLNQIKRLG